jgi:opacity protein-like surface antigen
MKKIALSCVALVLLASPALAATAATPVAAPAAQPAHHGVFEDADTNHDGIVTKQEWLDHESKYFDSLDTNHDGKLTQDEIQAARQKSHDRYEAWHQSHMKGNQGGSDTPAAANAGAGQ